MSGIEKSDVEEAILRALDKGIDDMENGRVVPHEYAMEIARQRLKECVLRPKSEQEIWDELAESRACYERGEYMNFDEALDMISRKEIYAILDESSRQVQEGKHRPADESLEELGRRYGISEEKL